MRTPHDAAPPLVEVVDHNDRPLLAMPLDEVHRQLLPHRSVAVLVYDTEERLFLQKRSRRKDVYPGRWDVSVGGHVHAGEARADAAERLVQAELGIRADRLRPITTLPASVETGSEFLTIYALPRTAQPFHLDEELVDGGYSYTREELGCLVREFRELLTPGLVFLWESDLAFVLGE